MEMFKINAPNRAIQSDLQKKIDNLTKPKGSLGVLEELALQIGTIQQSLNPSLKNPHHIIFAGDHGVAVEGVSLSPQEVTFQMIANFMGGGAGINFLARQHGFKLKVVDSGANYEFKQDSGLIDLKIAKGTKNYLYEPAMTKEQALTALERGAGVVNDCFNDGCNIISFGEMGIANTSSSAIWMHYFTGIDLKECVGAGCGLDTKGVEHKYNVLKRSIDNYKGQKEPLDIIASFGGFEMVMAVGGMLRAAELGMVIIVDGFIMTSCILAASLLDKNVMEYAIFGHQGDEAGHKLMLQKMGAKAILHLNLRLGEGTGAICAYPIIDSAVRMINEMNSFDNFDVTKYFK